MHKGKPIKTVLATACLLLITLITNAQTFTIQGVIYDFYSKRPIEAVSVQTTSGHFAISDSLGHYYLRVEQGDQFWFSYLGKNTQRYIVDTVTNYNSFDVALYIDARWLPNVTVRNRNYRMDSLQNRKDYAKAFNFQKPQPFTTSTRSPSTYVPGALTSGLDLNALIESFQFKKNRQMLALQNRLIQEEQDKYINYRFSKRLVKEVTKLDTAYITHFLQLYRPTYEALTQLNELELGYYVQECYRDYMRNRRYKLKPNLPQ